MKTKNKALIDFKLKYQNMWLARDPVTGAVLEADKSLAVLAEKMRTLNNDYTVEKVMPLNSVYVPSIIL